MFDQASLRSHEGEHAFTVERQFNVPRALMFQAFTRPEHLKHWWAPRPFTIGTCTVDLRPGGVWHYSMRSPEGAEHWARSVYRDIVPPEKLVYTSTFADEHANPIVGVPEHVTTVLFREEDGKTRVTAHIEFSSAEAMQTAISMGMQQGMNMAWDDLVEYVQELQAQ